MAKHRKDQATTGELVPFQSSADITVLPPNSGVVGKFLEDTQNMFRARSMRMKALFAKIDETGQRMEALLRSASERAEAAEAKLEDHLRGQGLLPELQPEEGSEDG
ncbi:MAG: hypothetical protein AB1646_11750 [Thermodesulfobacteriota bacterium]